MASRKSSRIASLKGLADGREARAARSLAQSLGVLKAKEAQLSQLRAYLDEYRRDAGEATLDAARWENSRRFVAELNAAVSLRETELEAARARYQQEADRWRDSHRRTKALEQLVDKYYREELKALQRRDQKEFDEQALRRRK